ncbi:MAG: hypothetical protein ACI8XB_000411 [Patiriisocius sp.]|jgi:hypothetical protein
MRNFQKIFTGLLTILIITIAFSCAKDEKNKGCMDIAAVNYDSMAEESGTCEYEQTELSIFENGTYGSWNGYGMTFLPCLGSFEIVPLSDGGNGMALVTDENGFFYGFFQTDNVNEGRYFSTVNSKLYFEARIPNLSIQDTINIFIRGQEPETAGSCMDVLASDRQLLKTEDLTNQMEAVSFNLLSFENLYLQNVGVLVGFAFEAAPSDTLMIINNVAWRNY